MRGRAWRRSQNLRIQKSRVQRVLDVWHLDLSNPETRQHWFGLARKSNFSCGCKICKPWKHFGNSKKFDKKPS
jgi:hypothetical protein